MNPRVITRSRLQNFVLSSALFLLSVLVSSALTSDEVVVLVNKNSPDSIKLGSYYADQRRIPRTQIIALDLPAAEDLPRKQYEDYVVPTLSKALQDPALKDRIRCLVTVYDLPLRIGRQLPTDHVKELLADAQARRDAVKEALLQITSSLEAVPKEFAPIPDLATLKPSATTASRRDEDLIKKALAAYTAADLRAAELQDAAERAAALEKIAAYRRELYGPRRNLDNAAMRDARVRLADMTRALNPITMTLEQQREWLDLAADVQGLAQLSQLLEAHTNNLSGRETEAAFDSELSLLWWDDYTLYRWLPNRLRRDFDYAGGRAEGKGRVLMVARLDGPTPEIVRRIIDNSLATEEKGLTGTFYIDARGLKPGDSYGSFDETLRRTAKLLQEKTALKVVLDDKAALFQKGDCPDAALYCGWYALSKYADAFNWVRGAVGYHVASSEATTLRNKNSQVWCKRMLEEGVCATLGPVGEPYLTAFPPPAEFFPLLLTGKWTLAECYYRTVPYHSWMMTLIGDPLYRPFKKNPAFKPEDLPRGLAIPDDWGK